MAACAKKAGESIIALTYKPNINPSKKFVEWREKRLNSTLGPKPQTMPNNQRMDGMASLPPSQNGDDMKDLIATVKVVAETLGTVGERPTHSSKAKQNTILQRRLWRLTGLCHADSPTQIPRVWREMIEADTYGDALDIFTQAIV